MNVALRTPGMTRANFLDWAERQGERYEFDGFQPVAMTGGSVNHNRMALNLHRALFARLDGSGCEPLGPDAGVATLGDAVRYPDALVTCTKVPGAGRLVPGVVSVFEVLSPTSLRIDRIDKRAEYRAVPTLRHYAILDCRSVAVTLLTRADADADWTEVAMGAGEALSLLELGIELPVDELYRGVELDMPDSA